MLFDALIKGLAASNDGDRRVVVLVDEYDHPLGGLLDDPKSLRAIEEPAYAALLGYTHAEMEKYLHENIAEMANGQRPGCRRDRGDEEGGVYFEFKFNRSALDGGAIL